MKKIMKRVAIFACGLLLLWVLNVLIQEGYARWRVREIERELEKSAIWVWADPIADEKNGWALWVEASRLLEANRVEGKSFNDVLLRPMPSTPEARREVLEKYRPVRELLLKSFDRPRMRAPDIMTGFMEGYSRSILESFLTLFMAEAMYCAEDGDVEGVIQAHHYYIQTLFRISDGGNKWATEWVPLMFSTIFSVLDSAADSPGMSADDVLRLLKSLPSEEEALAGYRKVIGNYCEKLWWLSLDINRMFLANVDVELDGWQRFLILILFSDAELRRNIYGLFLDVENDSLEELQAKYPTVDAFSWWRFLVAPRWELSHAGIAQIGFVHFKDLDKFRNRRSLTLAFMGALAYYRRHGVKPKALEDLVTEGILPTCPVGLAEDDVELVLMCGEWEGEPDNSWTRRTQQEEPEPTPRRRRGQPAEGVREESE